MTNVDHHRWSPRRPHPLSCVSEERPWSTPKASPWSRLLRPLRRVFAWWPGSETQPDPKGADLRESTSRVQLDLIRKAFDGVGGDLDPRSDGTYLCHPSRVLLRAPDVRQLEEFFDRRGDIYEGKGRVARS